MRRVIPNIVAVIAMILAPSIYAAAEDETVLITGANRGVGLALAAAFNEAGYSVIGTARRPESATDLKNLSVRVVQLDVTDPESVARMAEQLGDQPIDILVNNAGILADEPENFSEVDVESLENEFQVNALGPLRVTQALLPNVMASKRKIVANTSSMMGSMELNTFGCCLGYRASKAALNSFTKTLSVDMAGRGMTFVVLHPGYVRTDMNNGAGQITAAESAAGLYTVISSLDETDDGKFFNYDGTPMPW